jgi:hypothetical protein
VAPACDVTNEVLLQLLLTKVEAPINNVDPVLRPTSNDVPLEEYAPIVHVFRDRLPPDPVIAAPIMSAEVPVTRILELLIAKLDVLLM